MTLKQLQALKNNDGATLKNHKVINYKTGYQVATEGHKTRNAQKALSLIAKYNGNCGIWFSNGIYYIDKSHRENTLKKALEIGKQCKQKSILKWSNKSLVWC